LPLTAPVPPQVSDVTLTPGSAAGCPPPSGSFSNFISSSSSCTVALKANMTFTGTGGTPLSCATASLSLEAGGKSIAIACPSGGPNGTWTSSDATVLPNSGPANFTLSWKLKAGKKPSGSGVTGGDNTGLCTSAKPCIGSFDGRSAASPEVVQRAYSGAYDSQSVDAASARSGPILAATVTDSSGNEIQSIQRSGSTRNVNISVNVLGFQNSQTIPSTPIELSFGGNQGNGALVCGTGKNAGNPEFEASLAEGCSEVFATTTQPNPPICANQPPGPPVCVETNPGGGKLDKDLDKAMNRRINGSKSANTCVNPNRWASPNTVSQVVSQSPKDPRLIITMITDYGAIRSANGKESIPIRAFATFYVTGWAGDPCIGQANGTSNGLAYTHDDNPGSSNTGVLLGHFVKYVNSSPGGTGSGACSMTTFGDCIPILTK
jgi:hypothetical protein